MSIHRSLLLLLLLLSITGCARKSGAEDSSDTVATRDTMQRRTPRMIDPDGPPIRVDSPEPAVPITGDSIALRGSVRKGEKGIRYRLMQGRTMLVEGTVPAYAEPGDTTQRPRFATVLAKPKGEPGPGGRAPLPFLLQVMLDGSDTGKGSPRMMIPLTTSDTGDKYSGAFDLLFHNITLNNPRDCEAVQPVRRVGPRRLDPRFVMMLLLRGPTPEETARGYRSVIPAGTAMRSATLKDGTAAVDLTTTVQSAGDECTRTGIRAEIERSLRQISGVNSVQITVMGKPF